MAAVQNIDNYSGTLTVLYTTGVSTTLTVSTATGLPADGACNFDLTVAAEAGNTREVFHVTSKAGTVLTATGAQANTIGSNHNIGAVVTAGTIGTTYLAQIATAQTQNVVTGSRSLGTVFQNTGKNAMFLTVVINHGVGVGGADTAFSDSSNPPTTQVAIAAQNSGTFAYVNALTFIVLPGNFYKVTSGGGGDTINSWVEWQ